MLICKKVIRFSMKRSFCGGRRYFMLETRWRSVNCPDCIALREWRNK